MQNQKSKITLRDYLGKGKTFLIPDYQRGYVWGKSRKANKGQDKDSVTYMMQSILDGFYKDKPIFVQGMTVSEDRQNIIVVDGQQRTTFFYLLLNYLGFQGSFSLSYQVRKESNDFLTKKISRTPRSVLINNCVEDRNEDFQDKYFFKKTIRIVNKMVGNSNVNENDLIKYVLDQIQFLYIDIPHEKAITVFTMMNGNKAKMNDEDVLKAEMLRLVSLDTSDSELVRREQDLLRSRYAREWDRWLHWWKQPEVRDFFKVPDAKGKEHPLYILLTTYFAGKKTDDEYNFDNFKYQFLNSELQAKQTFSDLRHLQKRFEDVYNDKSKETHRHNTIGGIICVSDSKDVLAFIYDFFNTPPSDYPLEEFYKLTFLGGLTFKEKKRICKKECSEDDEKLIYAKNYLKEVIESDDLYNVLEYKEIAFRQLLRLNIEQDSSLGRMFNFNVWNNRSIEHIHPKSKVYFQDPNSGKCYLSEDRGRQIVNPGNDYFDESVMTANGCSRHCIGNMALLYTRNNSSFGAKDFEEKKNILFGNTGAEFFQSRELLHTLSLFARSKWTISEIAKNKQDLINKLTEYYGL